MWIYVWIAVTAIALIVELVTSEMVSVWFAGGGVVGLILCAAGLDWYIHLPAFIVVSAALMLCFRSIVIKKLNNGEVKTNAETALGKEVELLSAVSFKSTGTVKINGVIWNAVAENEEIEIPVGKKVRIIGIIGNKYIVKEID